MTATLQDRRIAFLVSNEGTEQIELTRPWGAIEAAGGQPVLLATEAGEVQAFNHLDKADTFIAGAHWKDEEVVVDDLGPNVLVSSRNPDDLDAFCSTAVAVFAAE
jgi:protease I